MMVKITFSTADTKELGCQRGFKVIPLLPLTFADVSRPKV